MVPYYPTHLLNSHESNCSGRVLMHGAETRTRALSLRADTLKCCYERLAEGLEPTAHPFTGWVQPSMPRQHVVVVLVLVVVAAALLWSISILISISISLNSLLLWFILYDDGTVQKVRMVVKGCYLSWAWGMIHHRNKWMGCSGEIYTVFFYSSCRRISQCWNETQRYQYVFASQWQRRSSSGTLWAELGRAYHQTRTFGTQSTREYIIF